MFPSSKFSMIYCPYEPNCPRSFQCLFSHVQVQSVSSRKRTYEVSQLRVQKALKDEPSEPSKDPIKDRKSDAMPSRQAEKKSMIIKKKKNIIDLSQPPSLKPDFNAKIARGTRQKSLLKYYEEFKRIYRDLLVDHPELAHEHSYIQEEAVHQTTSALTYTSKAVSVLQRLRKRSLAKSLQDIGIDGEWIPIANIEKKEIPIDRLKLLCMPLIELYNYKYPLSIDIISVLDLPVQIQDAENDQKNEITPLKEKSDEKEDVTTTQEKQICNRCSKPFLVKNPLQEYEKEECHYHFGALRSTMIEGNKVRSYTCCESTQGTSGCSVGPHVFKEETFDQLNKRIPFRKLNDIKVNCQKSHHFLALDCEMSYTTAGMECTRVTVVSWQGEILLDELVLPSFPVLDLNTRWSGISDLSNAKFTLNDIQLKIAELSGPDTILSGHGLENDLNVLRLIHTSIIDTAYIYPHTKGFPFRNSLRSLVTRYLGRFIQTSASGHDSFEDTFAVVQLLKAYLKSHP